jgi:hypothetical protein
MAGAVLSTLVSCGTASYPDVDVQARPRPPTARQQREYDVHRDQRVLGELTAANEAPQLGWMIAFEYRPYMLRIKCSRSIQVQEDRFYRRWLRPRIEAVGRPADCGRVMFPGFEGAPNMGEMVYLSVVDDAGDCDWGVVVVEARR